MALICQKLKIGTGTIKNKEKDLFFVEKGSFFQIFIDFENYILYIVIEINKRRAPIMGRKIRVLNLIKNSCHAVALVFGF